MSIIACPQTTQRTGKGLHGTGKPIKSTKLDKEILAAGTPCGDDVFPRLTFYMQLKIENENLAILHGVVNPWEQEIMS